MPKLTPESVREGLKDDRKGQQLVITGRQISSIEGIESFINSSKIYHIDFSFNMIRGIPNSLTYPNLLFLDLSTNLITKIENLENLKSLQVLRLSRNRISKIEGLSMNTNLNGLDLSMNQITRIENLNHLSQLKLLYLYGNSIKSLEGLNGLGQLEELRIEQNSIEDINHLATFNNQIKELEAHSNKVSDLDNVIKTLFKLNKLKKLSLYNNPIFSDVTYKFRILKYKNIEYLDGLLVKEYIRDVLEDMKENYDLDQIVIESQRNINQLIEQEREVKDIAVKLLSMQMQRLEDDFIEFSKSMENELEHLNEYAAVIRTKKNLGEEIVKDMEKIQNWVNNVRAMEEKKQESIEKRIQMLRQEKASYLNDKRTNIDFTGKLLKISQEDPRLWRDIKDEMFQKRVNEERNSISNKAITMAKSSSLGVVKSDGQEVDVHGQIGVMNVAMGNVLNDLGGQMARDMESRLNNEDKVAASKIQQRYKDNKDSKACVVF